MKDDYDGSHFTPDVFCPFCNQNVKKHAKDCIGKRFPFTSKDKAENSERLRKLYKNDSIMDSVNRWCEKCFSNTPHTALDSDKIMIG